MTDLADTLATGVALAGTIAVTGAVVKGIGNLNRSYAPRRRRKARRKKRR